MIFKNLTIRRRCLWRFSSRSISFSVSLCARKTDSEHDGQYNTSYTLQEIQNTKSISSAVRIKNGLNGLPLGAATRRRCPSARVRRPVAAAAAAAHDFVSGAEEKRHRLSVTPSPRTRDRLCWCARRVCRHRNVHAHPSPAAAAAAENFSPTWCTGRRRFDQVHRVWRAMLLTIYRKKNKKKMFEKKNRCVRWLSFCAFLGRVRDFLSGLRTEENVFLEKTSIYL